MPRTCLMGCLTVFLAACSAGVAGSTEPAAMPAATGTMAPAGLETEEGSPAYRIYVVDDCDEFYEIADRFNLAEQTLIWANPALLQADARNLRPQMRLLIPVAEGTGYEWQVGDQLDLVAGAMGVSAESVLAWPGNDLYLRDGLFAPEPGAIVYLPAR